MKPVYKCDYCKFMGNKEEVRQHEETCTDNYTKKSCYTCEHRTFGRDSDNNLCFACKAGVGVPTGKVWENCKSYSRKIKSETMEDIYFQFAFWRFKVIKYYCDRCGEEITGIYYKIRVIGENINLVHLYPDSTSTSCTMTPSNKVAPICKLCCTYDWDEHKEVPIPKEEVQKLYETQLEMEFCPKCGRKL